MLYVRRLLVFMLITSLCLCLGCGSDDAKSSAKAMLPEAQIAVQLLPTFSWPAFLRFWHRGAHEKVDINQAKPSENGYTYDFGHGVSVQVMLNAQGIVTHATLQFVSHEGNDSGGLQFIRVMQHMMRIGTYGWEAKPRENLYKYYEVMSPQMKEFYYMTSYFVRTYNAQLKVWSFSYYFVSNTHELQTAPAVEF